MTNTPFDPATAETWEALARYVTGESSAPEAAALRAWLQEDPRRSELLDTMRRTVDRMSVPAADVDVEAALQRVRARMRDEEPRTLSFTLPEAPPRRRAMSWAPLLRAAAFAAVLIGGVFLWRRAQESSESQLQVQAQFYMTSTGQMDTLQLSDGSVVILGPSSDLQIEPDFGTATRTVILSGVAMFQVQHDETRPFIVRAGDAVVQDLGTVFTVWHDAETGVRVAVTEGSVMLQRTVDDVVYLNAGDRGVVANNARTAKAGAAGDADTAWTRGELVFDNADIGAVAADLRRWYGIELQVPPAMKERHITATFRAHERAHDVLNVLGAVLGARITMRGDTAVLDAGTR